jgi:hypothetical protein
MQKSCKPKILIKSNTNLCISYIYAKNLILSWVIFCKFFNGKKKSTQNYSFFDTVPPSSRYCILTKLWAMPRLCTGTGNAFHSLPPAKDSIIHPNFSILQYIRDATGGKYSHSRLVPEAWLRQRLSGEEDNK